MKKFAGIIFIYLLWIMPVMLFASDLSTERKAYLLALSDLQRGKQQEFIALASHLRNYELYPYLLYANLAVHISQANTSELQGFLNAYSDTPLAAHLRALWLYQLAFKNDWQNFLQIYPRAETYIESHKDLNLACYHKEALWKTGQYPLAITALSQLLNTSASTVPKSCLWVLGQALSVGNIAQHLLWERIQKAFDNNNLILGIELAKFLPADQQNIFMIWKAVYQNPGLILNPILLKFPEDMRDNILLTGIQKISAKNPRMAVNTWKRLQESINFNLNTQAKAIRIIALDLAQMHDPNAVAWLMAVPEKYAGKNIREWRIRSALWQQDWGHVKQALSFLSKKEQKTTQWRYWLARALAGEGQITSAKNIYHDLSLRGDFYGQLASVQLNQKPLAAIENLKVNAAQINAIANLPAMRRAYELYQLRWLPEANQEWQWAIAHLPEEDYLAATELAMHWGWFEKAISTVNLINDLGNIPLRFPLAYRTPIMMTAQKNQMNPAWLFALIRQESLFTPYAHSSAGAIGLMQLMPQTASLMASQLHMGAFSPEKLLDADMNLYLGSAYLKKMLIQFNGHPILATAAYNAGPNRVKKWLPPALMPADIWIENIPYPETRQYVKNIMTSTTFYEKELGLPLTLAERVQIL